MEKRNEKEKERREWDFLDEARVNGGRVSFSSPPPSSFLRLGEEAEEVEVEGSALPSIDAPFGLRKESEEKMVSNFPALTNERVNERQKDKRNERNMG